ncbi:MAG: integrase arm-type DNA-binding domain-containing protein [Oxalobacter sp.]|nr:integrase arm-type DNA-binding domain-containing protein [Oxalobacter sp.]
MATSAPLTDTLIRGLKVTGTAYRKADGNGLFLEVTPKGKKVWRYRAKNVAGTKSGQILMTLGEYPAVTLAEARQKRQELREMIAKGLDPRQVIKQQEQAEQARKASTLDVVAYEWLQDRTDAGKVEKKTLDNTRRLLERHVFPVLGKIPMADITPRNMLDLLKSIATSSTVNMNKAKRTLSRIFSHAISMGKAERNPVSDINTNDVLPSHTTKHHITIGLDELPAFLQAVERDGASLQVKSAMHLMMLLFMRKGELINAEWSHIDLKSGLWMIPAENTKKRREQVYPLPRQAVTILTELQRYTGEGRYVFSTGARNKDAPIGIHTLNHVLTRMGYYGKMTVHGFRALATSWLDEQGYSRQAIERQLSHLEKGQTNQAYHRADYMNERREMLQAWADHLDSIKEQEIPQTGDKAA